MNPLPPVDEEQLQSAVHAALTEWTRGAQTDSPMAQQLLLLRQAIAEREQAGDTITSYEAASILLESLMTELEAHNETASKVLRLRFYDGEITRQVAARMHASPDQVNRWQRAAIIDLTSLLMAREMAARANRTAELESMLPASPYSRLFGLQSLQTEITEQLLRDGEPLVIALSGIGGIGKTSLADAVVRLVAPMLAFDQIVWIRAAAGSTEPPDQEMDSWEQAQSVLQEQLGIIVSADGEMALGQIKEQLRKRPILVVFDNLEEEVQTLLFLEKARELGGQGKFLLTTRARPTVSAPSYFRSLEELDFADAADLLRHQARSVGIKALAAADVQDLRSIYDVTGGNPLALRLVAGLAAVMPLAEILRGLRQSRPGPIEDLYRAIYWEAWRSLSPQARSLLQAMPLVAATGALPDQLRAISGLTDDDLWSAVHELFGRSLLEVRGTMHERRYSIHRLTETFLRTEIVGWPESR